MASEQELFCIFIRHTLGAHRHTPAAAAHKCLEWNLTAPVGIISNALDARGTNGH